MRLLASILVLAASLHAQDPLAAQLDQVAKIASVMMDGDLAMRLVTPRAMASILDMNPQDEWAAADNYDVDHKNYIAAKKTTIRLARLCATPCDVNLWMPIPAKPGRIHVVIRNANEMSQFWTWGMLHQETPAEMKRVLESGERVTVSRRRGMVSVLAPVRDSLGDIVGVAEVVGQSRPNPQENVK